MNAKTCPSCQSPIPEHAPGGLCPACVLQDADEPAADSSDAPPLEDVAAAFPKLEILRLIGHGGMGYVYQARQPELDRMVALKILSPALSSDPAFAERFAREARVLGKLQHPNIVTLFEHGESGGFFYLLMEYIDGVNLRQAMSAGRFTPEQALAIVPSICDALQSAHAEGVWHRDIKPENILLDKDARVKIADFGIARILGDPQRNFTLTRTGGMLGSAAYMAPEQHEKPHDVDHRADIYSLGVVIYEMLTGELPLGRFPLPSRRASVNARIDEIVMRTLEKERELRQQSADEVKTEVEGAGRLQPPTPQSARKRKGAPAVLIGCGVMLLLGLLAIPLVAAIWYFSLRTEAQRVAVEQRIEAREATVRLEDANVPGTTPDNRAQGKVASEKSEPLLEILEKPLDAKQPTSEIIVNVLADGSLRIEGAMFELRQLGEKMSAVALKHKDQPIRIHAEGKVPYQRLVEVIDACQRAGIWNISFAKELSSENGDANEAIEAIEEQSRNTPAAAIKALLQAARERNARVFSEWILRLVQSLLEGTWRGFGRLRGLRELHLHQREPIGRHQRRGGGRGERREQAPVHVPHDSGRQRVETERSGIQTLKLGE